jgi:hypothetical protein
VDAELTPPADAEPELAEVGSEPSADVPAADPGSFAPLDLVAESDGQVEPSLSIDISADSEAPADDNPADNVVLDFNADDLKKAG